MDTKSPAVKITAIVLFIVLLGLVVVFVGHNSSKNQIIGIIEPLQHVAVNDVTNGIKDGLGELANSVVIEVENANNDNTLLAQIISKYQDQNVSIYVPIFTNTAQTTKAIISDKPIIFAAVTDPIDAGLLDNIKKPSGNITGVSDLWPISSNLQLIRDILPNSKIIGVVYDPGDPSSAATMPILKEECNNFGFTLKPKPVSSAIEIDPALSSLKNKIDVLFTANDVTVTAAFSSLVAFAIQNKIPLFAGDYSSVKRGAIGAVGQNYYNVGQQTGKLVSEILNGKKIRELPVVFTTGGDTYLNAEAADKMGVVLPDDVKKNAKEIYKTIISE